MPLRRVEKRTTYSSQEGNKSLDLPSSYIPICVLDAMGKLLERLILQRLEEKLDSSDKLSNK